MASIRSVIQNMDSNCTVVVNGCDKYKDAWLPFFELIKIYWKSLRQPFVLNTEKERYNCEGIDLTCVNEKVEEAL